MKYDFDNTPRREGASDYKYDMRAGVFGREDVIPLWVADMDFAVLPAITESIKRRAAHPVYPYEFNKEPYYDVVTQWIGERGGWTVEREWISYVPGVVGGLVFAVRALTSEGDGVLIQPPVYPPFASVVKANGRELLTNPLVRDGNTYRIDFDDLDRKLPQVKALMLCNPQNPTGRVFTREELLRTGELCVKHGVWIISDEIHSDLIRRSAHHTHIASLSPEIGNLTVTLMAPSKTFNIAGLSTAYSVIPDSKLLRRFNKQIEITHAGMENAFGRVALHAAYSSGREWLAQLMEYVEGNADYVKKFLAKNIPSVKTYDWEGTYLLWLDFTQWGMTDEELKDFLIWKAGLGLNDGLSFGAGGEGHARMNLATSRSVLERAMKQLLDAFLELK